MTKTDLIAQVAANTEMSKKSAELAVNAAFEALGKAMAEGEKITISGFGTFEIRERAERQGINPRTRKTERVGRIIQIQAEDRSCSRVKLLALVFHYSLQF